RRAALTDLDAIKNLADAHKHELGFVLRPALASSIGREEVFIAQNSQDVIGFVEYHHRRDHQTTLYHIAVESHHRRQGIGRLLVDELIRDAGEHEKEFIQLKCPADLEANEFYRSLGFNRVDTRPNKDRRLVIWNYRLVSNLRSGGDV
ncbi:MAG: GNAT family N-acetyltransferase, partial [Anaerolineae bacterium]